MLTILRTCASTYCHFLALGCALAFAITIAAGLGGADTATIYTAAFGAWPLAALLVALRRIL